MGMAQPEARRLLRRTEGKVIAGVASGLGDYFGVDAVWFRLGFVLFALLGGAGLIAYIVLWAVMPEGAASAPSPVEVHAERIARSLKGTPAWIGAALLVLGGILVVSQMVDWRPGVFWGLALIVLGILFFRQTEAAPAPPPTAPPGVPGSTEAVAEGFGPPPLPSPAAPSPPRVRRERSRLGWFTIGVLFLALGAASALDLGDVLEIRLVHYLALSLAVIGAGLLTGAWWGRARWLVVPGVLLVPVVLTASLISVPLEGGWGDRYVHPANVQAIAREYHLAGGSLFLDLHDLQLGPGPISIRATTAIGTMNILVPPDTPIRIRARVGGGEVDLFGRTNAGVRVDVTRTFNTGPAPGVPPVLVLDLETSLGVVQVIASEEPVPVQ